MPLGSLGLWTALLLSLVALPARALNIVATTEDVAGIAREVVGVDGEVTTLANPNQDPHFVDARPSLLMPMSRADALVLVGLELEVGWLPVLLKGCRNANVQIGSAGYIDAATFIQPMDVPTGPVDRSMGDVHPRGNPHYLKDPSNAVLVANGLAERFIDLDPGHAEGYRKRAAAFSKALQERMKGWETRLAFLKARPIICYHKSLNYFSRWAQMDTVGFVEPKPGIPPSPSHVMQLITLARARKVNVFAMEAWFPGATTQVVAEKSGAVLITVPGLPREKQRYADHIEDLVVAFEKSAPR